MEIIELGIITIVVYFLCVIIVKYVKNISTIESKKIVNNYLKDLFFTEDKTINNYNIAIGLDNNGYPMANILDTYFQPLAKIFSNIYFYNCWKEENRFVYVFVVDEPLVEMSDEDIYNYCSKRCNTIVHKILHQYNPYVTWGQNITAINLCSNQLYIYLANNIKGEEENILLKRQMRTLFKRSQISATPPIEEDWGDLQ